VGLSGLELAITEVEVEALQLGRLRPHDAVRFRNYPGWS
jgi:hypothetical protein